MYVDWVGEVAFPKYWGLRAFFAKAYKLTLYMFNRRETSLNMYFLAQICAYDPKMDVDREGEDAFPGYKGVWLRSILGRNSNFIFCCIMRIELS